MKKKLQRYKYIIIISGLLIAFLSSNFIWYKLYNREIKRVKNSLIPPLTNDYYSNQLILTNNIKKYEQGYYPSEIPSIKKDIEDKYSFLDKQNEKVIYDIPLVNQLPHYPNGCEAASSVMLLKFYGVDISLDEFIKYLPKDKIYTENGTRFGSNPALFYAGDPKSETGGWGLILLLQKLLIES